MGCTQILFEQKDSLPDEILQTWRQASLGTPLPDPLCSDIEWAWSYHRSHGPDRPIFALAEHSDLLILAEERFENETLLLPLESSWLYSRPLLGQDPLTLLFHAVDLLEAHYRNRPFPTIVFGGMWPHQPFSNELLLHFSHVFDFFLNYSGKQCGASLDGGVDGFLSRRSPNFRSKLRKSLRLAREAGVVYERIAPEEEEADQIYQRMLNVEARSWKGKEENGLLHPLSTEFYRQLLAALSRNARARVIFARHEGEDIGFIFGGVARGIYRGQQFSYDTDWSRYSIGNTLQYEQITWLCEEKTLRYDMGPITGPKMEYKRHWTELVFPLESWILRHKYSR